MTFTEQEWVQRFGASKANCGPVYDPESLLTGGEVAAGLSYQDHRDWPSQAVWEQACRSEIANHLIQTIRA